MGGQVFCAVYAFAGSGVVQGNNVVRRKNTDVITRRFLRIPVLFVNVAYMGVGNTAPIKAPIKHAPASQNADHEGLS